MNRVLRDPKFATVDMTAYIDPQAKVDYDQVTIGARTKVWQFASVIRGSVIGEDCSIASCAIVDGCRLGDRVIVSHGAFLDPGMLIGSDVFIGPHVAMCNDYWPRVTKEGWFKTDDLTSGRVNITTISHGASLGAGVIVMPGIKIGRNAMVAAGAVVTKWLPDNHLLRRDGVMVPIEKEPNRMRSVA